MEYGDISKVRRETESTYDCELHGEESERDIEREKVKGPESITKKSYRKSYLVYNHSK